MSVVRAPPAVYTWLHSSIEYPTRSLCRFKTDPRVKVGPTRAAYMRDPFVVFAFAAELLRKRKTFYVFLARARLYAIEARSARQARRVVEQYQVIHDFPMPDRRVKDLRITASRHDAMERHAEISSLDSARMGLLRVLRSRMVLPSQAISRRPQSREPLRAL